MGKKRVAGGKKGKRNTRHREKIGGGGKKVFCSCPSQFDSPHFFPFSSPVSLNLMWHFFSNRESTG